MAVKDINGKELEIGDDVIITQNLKVKGAKEIKRGTVVKNIRLTDDDAAIEGKVDGTTMVIKTIYVKKK
jgi:protein PhnA